MVDNQKHRKPKLMKITLRTVAAGPRGIAKPGTVLTMPEDEAEQYIANRFAREYDPKLDAKATHGLTLPEVSK